MPSIIDDGWMPGTHSLSKGYMRFGTRSVPSIAMLITCDYYLAVDVDGDVISGGEKQLESRSVEPAPTYFANTRWDERKPEDE